MYNPKTECYLCGSRKSVRVCSGVRGGEDTNVLKCCDCGLVRLDKFVTDCENFYENSGMWQSNGMNSGIQQARREAEEDDSRRAAFVKNYIKNRRVLDFGCGSGGFMHRIREIADCVSGVEPEVEKRSFLRREGFSCFESVDALPEQEYDVITMFHVLEHLPDPVDCLEKQKKHLAPDGVIIIEVPNADDALLSLYESSDFERFTYWVCHLYLFTSRTLQDLAKKCSLKISMMQQVQRYPLSNHLYWLCRGKPGGHKKWAAFNDPLLDSLYGERLAALGIADTIVAVLKL